LLLAVIPVVLIFIGINLRLANQNYSMFNIDPEFSLLFSGIALGHGSINLFIDHPGTPVIVFAAIIMRIIHLFRPSSSFTQDVLQNPDFYLNALNISMIVFITLIIFFAGWCIYRKTGNLPAAIFIQFSPFVVEHVISIIERFMPEPWFIAHVIVLCSITVLDLYGYFNNTKLKYQSWLVYGVIIGFGISLKLTFLPFFLAPLFLLTGIRKKSYYLGTTALSFLIFTFPIFKRSREFFRWTKALAINSGRYGSGKASVIDPDQFFIQLKAIIQSEKYLVYITILALLVLIISLLPWVRRRMGNKRYIAALAGFTATLIVGILIISKQYAGHYLVPYSLLTVFICYLSINVLIEIVQFRKWWLEAIIYSLVALMMLSNPKSIKQHKKYLEIRRQNLSYKKEIVTEIEKLPQSDEYWKLNPNELNQSGLLTFTTNFDAYWPPLNQQVFYPLTYGTITFGAEDEIPDPPTGTQITWNSPTAPVTITMSWQQPPINDFDHFNIYMNEGSGFELLGETIGTQVFYTTNNTDSTLFYVTTVDKAGQESEPSENMIFDVALNINEAMGSQFFNIYPNPSGNITNINCKIVESGFYSIRIFDLNGRLIQIILIKRR
jgi:hypothetical protein